MGKYAFVCVRVSQDGKYALVAKHTLTKSQGSSPVGKYANLKCDGKYTHLPTTSLPSRLLFQALGKYHVCMSQDGECMLLGNHILTIQLSTTPC